MIDFVANLAAPALPPRSHALIESVDALAFLSIAPLALALRTGISPALGVFAAILGAVAHVLYAANVVPFGRSWPAVALFSLAAFALGFWLLTVRIDRLHCVPAVGAILLGAGSAAAFVVGLRPDHLSPRSPFEYAVLITFGLGATGVAIGLPVWAMVTGLRLRIAARTSGNGPASARAFLLHGSDGPANRCSGSHGGIRGDTYETAH